MQFSVSWLGKLPKRVSFELRREGGEGAVQVIWSVSPYITIKCYICFVENLENVLVLLAGERNKCYFGNIVEKVESISRKKKSPMILSPRDFYIVRPSFFFFFFF